jgi:hypothetical protein
MAVAARELSRALGESVQGNNVSKGVGGSVPASIQHHVIAPPTQSFAFGSASCRATLRPTGRTLSFVVRLVWLSGALLAAACGANEPAEKEAQRILVEFVRQPPAADAEQLGNDYGLRVIKLFPSAPIAVFELKGNADPAALMQRLARDPAVKNVEIDQRVSHQEQP